MLNAYEQLE